MNVILIAIDTLRADHLSCYGYRRLTSPHLDRFAHQGTLFSHFFTPHPPTHPAFTTMHTGVDAMQHQVVSHSGQVELDPGIPTLAEIFRQHGYHTVSVDNLGRWFTRGFERVEPYRWETDTSQPWRKAEAVNAQLLPVLDDCARQEKPFFLFAHYWDPHTPYLPPPPFDRMFYGGDEKDPANRSMEPVWEFEPFRDYFAKWMGGVTDIQFPVAQYDAEIAYVDAALAHVFARLDALGLTPNTLVVVTSDHGEIMDEHEGYFDHHGLYEGNLHIPLIMRLPGRIPPGLRLGGLTRMLDLAPTLLDYAGLGHAAGSAGMLGRSLRPLVESGSHEGTTDTLYLSECTWMKKRGIRTREWKLIVALEPDFHHMPPRQLYYLPEDPTEQRNLAAERPDIVAELEGQLNAGVEQRMRETGKPDPMSYQSITLRRIGGVKAAVPADEKLYAEGGRDRH